MTEQEEFEFRLRLEKERGAASQPTPKKERTLFQRTGDEVAGFVRGAGSIGATLLTPVDAAARALGVENEFIGRRDRREAMDSALASLGADTSSNAYGFGKAAAEIAGTAGVGGVLAKGAQALGAAPTAIRALQTAGMTTGQPGGLALRTLAGGAVGGASAGLVNPEDAGKGAIFGGATPGVLKMAGAAGQGIGRMIRGPEQPAQVAAAVKSAQDLGLVIPPTQANPSLKNRLLEGAAGKITTAQNASAKNAPKVNEAAAKALGLPADTQLTPEVISNVKTAAGALYEAVGAAGVVKPGAAYTAALDDIARPHVQAAAGFPNAKPSPVLQMVESLRSEAFDASSAVAKIKELRSTADDAFKPGGAGADIGRAAKKAAKALEDALDDHLQAIGEPDLLGQFRNARALYAKAATVEGALNKASGNVNAQKLAADLQKGKPLSGDLKKIAEAAGQFKTAFKPVEQMGSLPQWSPLDLYGGVGAGGALTALTGNPASMALAAAPIVRAGARRAALSPRVQSKLVQDPMMQLGARLSPEELQALYRFAPTLAAD